MNTSNFIDRPVICSNNRLNPESIFIVAVAVVVGIVNHVFFTKKGGGGAELLL
jgi:hypothetical protein